MGLRHLLVLAAVAAVALTACGGDDGGTNGSDPAKQILSKQGFPP